MDERNTPGGVVVYDVHSLLKCTQLSIFHDMLQPSHTILNTTSGKSPVYFCTWLNSSPINISILVLYASQLRPLICLVMLEPRSVLYSRTVIADPILSCQF